MEFSTSSWSLDHVGHAVRNLELGVKYYEDVLGFHVEWRETLSAEGVHLVFMKLANSLIEILAPIGNVQSAFSRSLDKRGEGLHHICFRVPSVSEELKRLRQLQLRLIDEQPRSGARGHYVAFLHPSNSHGALIELCSETP